MIRLNFKRAEAPGDPRDVAIDWISREQDGRLSAEDQAGLQAWLDEDPAHAGIYAHARHAVTAPGRHSAHPDLMDLRREALAAFKESRPPLRHAAAAAAGLAAVLLLGSGWTLFQPDISPTVSPLEVAARSAAPMLNPNAAIYKTAVGERVSVKLPDGSLATLNTDTLLKVAYVNGERGIRLVRGQALFEVAKNERVPFRVYAGDRRITAVGTTFDVRIEGGKVKVALVEGVVSVGAAPARPVHDPNPLPVQQVVLAPGEILEARSPTDMLVRAGAAEVETAWRAGVVSFRATPLAEAVAEVNRYTTTPLTIGDPAIAGYRITGVFRTGDPQRFARSVTEVLPVLVKNSEDGTMVLVTDPKKSGIEG